MTAPSLKEEASQPKMTAAKAPQSRSSSSGLNTREQPQSRVSSPSSSSGTGAVAVQSHTKLEPGGFPPPPKVAPHEFKRNKKQRHKQMQSPADLKDGTEENRRSLINFSTESKIKLQITTFKNHLGLVTCRPIGIPKDAATSEDRHKQADYIMTKRTTAGMTDCKTQTLYHRHRPLPNATKTGDEIQNNEERSERSSKIQ